MRRRDLLTVSTCLLATLSFASNAANAQTWPDKPVKFVVPYGPGGATDAVARPWAEALGNAFKQQFIIENRGGAAGMIGTEAVAKAPPDGYTFLFASAASLTVLPGLRKTSYDPVKGFAPVARVGDLITGFVIHPSLGIKTFQEMIAYAKKNPGKLVYASSGTGTGTHLRLEALKVKSGVDIMHVPYRGGADSLNDLLPGTVHMMNEPVTLPHVKAGKLILLNINGKNRRPDFPDVPTLAELGISGGDVPIWFVLTAPAGTPKEIITKLNAKIVELAQTEEIKTKLWSVNAVAPIQTPEEIVKELAEDTRINAELIKAGNIKLE